MRGTKSFKHKADRERTQASDILRIDNALHILYRNSRKFGTETLYSTMSSLMNEKFKIGIRFPDITCIVYHELAKDVKVKEIIPIELDGAVHGWGSDYDESDKTKIKMNDYVRAGYYPIIANEEWLFRNGISLETYLLCCVFNQTQLTRAKARIERYE